MLICSNQARSFRQAGVVAASAAANAAGNVQHASEMHASDPDGLQGRTDSADSWGIE